MADKKQTKVYLIPEDETRDSHTYHYTAIKTRKFTLENKKMRLKKFNKLDFKKLHPAGTLGAKLKTVEDIMLTGKKIPFVNEKLKMITCSDFRIFLK